MLGCILWFGGNWIREDQCWHRRRVQCQAESLLAIGGVSRWGWYIAGRLYRIRQISFHIFVALSWLACPSSQLSWFTLVRSPRLGSTIFCDFLHLDVWTGTRIPSMPREGRCVSPFSSRTNRAWTDCEALPGFLRLGRQCGNQASRRLHLGSWVYAGRGSLWQHLLR